MAGGGSGEVAFQRRGFSNVQGGGTDWRPADGARLTKDELTALLEARYAGQWAGGRPPYLSPIQR